MFYIEGSVSTETPLSSVFSPLFPDYIRQLFPNCLRQFQYRYQREL